MNTVMAEKLISHYIARNIPVMLWGKPGSAKSDLARQVSMAFLKVKKLVQDSEKGKLINFVDFRSLLRDPTDLKGFGAVDKEKGITIWLRPEDLPFVGNDKFAETGVIFLDEINAASMAMQAALFGLVLDRRVGQHVLKPGWVIIAAGNRMSDKAAAQKMPTALANRFAHIDIDPDAPSWAMWADKNNINPLVVAFIRFRPQLIHDMNVPAGTELRAFPSPRSITVAANAIDGMDVTTDSVMMYEIVRGICGDAFAAEFIGFAKIYAQLPSLDQILSNPMGSKVPDEPASLYAITTGMARKVDVKSWANALKYAARMPKEFEVTFVQSATHRNNALAHNPAYVQWVTDNQNVLM